MKTKKYIKLVLKKLKCSRRKKKEIQKELESDIAIAMENGESSDEILKRLGTPAALAREFNDNFSEEELKAFKRRKLGKITGICAGIFLLLLLAFFYIIPRGYPLDQSRIYTEAEVIDRAHEVISCFSKEEYAALRAMLTDQLKEILPDARLTELRNMFGNDWGDFITYGNAYTSEVRQFGKSVAVIQINATYEHTAITYTLTFDQNMNLCGFYMK